MLDLNQGRVRINTLGFGLFADMNMLRRIAKLNRGKSKRVFEELNAAQQVALVLGAQPEFCLGGEDGGFAKKPD